jgi:hypothetical protein
MCQDVDQDMARRRAFLNKVMDPRIQKKIFFFLRLNDHQLLK